MATGNNGPIRVLIVDDHKIERAGLRSLPAEFPRLTVVGEAATARAAQGDSVLHPAVKRVLMGNGQRAGEAIATGKLGQHTAQEQRALALVANRQTRKKIADALGLSEKTVRNVMTGVMEKLGVERRAQAAAWHVRHTEGGNP